MLTILDTKSSSLMIFNSVLAIVTAEPFFSAFKHEKVILLLVMMATLSSLISFFVVRMSWPFLGKRDHSNEILNLAKEIDKRTRIYQVSWMISFFTVVALMAFMAYWLFQ